MTNDALRNLITAPALAQADKVRLIQYIHRNREQTITVLMGIVDAKPAPAE